MQENASLTHGTNVKRSSINDTGNLEELKIGQTADMGEGDAKIRKNCRRRLWMVPNTKNSKQYQ